MNKIEEKYLNEILYEKCKYIKNGYCDDNDIFHENLDDILVNFIKELGYQKIAKEYEDASGYFWYS